MSRPGGDQRAAVHDVHHAPHLGTQLGQPPGRVVVAARRRLGPHAVNQPERVVGVLLVPPQEGPVEGGREHRVETHRVRVRPGNEREPAGVRGVVRRELRWEAARESRAQVHALHVEGAPRLGDPDFETFAGNAGRNVRAPGWRGRGGRHP